MADGAKYTKIGKFDAHGDPFYNAKVHGPFYPWRDYRVPQRPSIWNMKLGEIWPHILQSDRSPQNLRYMMRLTFWRIASARYPLKKFSLKPIMQGCIVAGMVLFFLRKPDYAAERRVKYHW